MKPKKIVACCGSFDGEIHPGHLFFLTNAKKYGTELIVFVGSDETIRRNKQREPMFNQPDRIEHVRQTNIASSVLPLVDDFSQNLSITLDTHLDVFCFGHDQKGKWVDDLQRIFKEYDIITHVIPAYRRDLYATSKQIQKSS